MSLDEQIFYYVLANAIRYAGKPNPGAVFGKAVAEHPELKKDMKALNEKIAAAVKRAVALSVDEQRAVLEKHAPELLEAKKEEKKELIDLPNAVQGKVVMRLAPSPSGPLHIGHAYVLALNAELCRKYRGKLLLRLEDTNPENLDPAAYKMIPEDAQWLTMQNVHEVFVQSDRLDSYYAHAEKILKLGKAYVCMCDAEVFRKLLGEGKACPDRDLSVDEQLARWKKMFKGYKPGDAVMRIKTELSHPNPAMRDWPAFRMNEHAHPRQKKKYHVWPLMNFAVAVDDHVMGITHTVRGKDHKDNEKRQQYVFEYFGWKPPVHLYVGRINFEGFELSTTETRKKIEGKVYEGWDDIRLPFLRAFQRRGYRPEAFVKLALGMGVAENDKTVSQEEFYKLLNHWNKEVIDPVAKRFFLVIDPVEVVVEGAPKKTVGLLAHPDNPKLGKRVFMTHEKFYLAREDLNAMKEGRMHRLMDCCNVVKKGKKLQFVSLEYEKFRDAAQKGMIVHYLPVQKEVVKVEVMLPDHTVVKGLAEPSVEKSKVGDVMQAERFGFMRLDAVKKGVYSFWFAHK